MLNELIYEVNKEVLLTTVRGFSARGFSGDIVFRRSGREITRTVSTTFVPDAQRPAFNERDASASIEAYWPSILMWLDCMSTDRLEVRYSNGKITKVRSWEGESDE